MAAYLERDFARFYDWTYQECVEDVPLYVALARERGASVLDLACGTGRLAIALARYGIEVVGLDVSGEMLRIAADKLRLQPDEVRMRVRYVEGDMRAFDLARQFPLVIIPQASLFLLHSRREQTDCLMCAARHLLPGGALVVDLIPAGRMASQAVGETVSVRCGVCPATGEVIEELNRKLVVDRQAQCVTVEHTYIERSPGGSERRHVFVEDYTWITEGQMRTMLRRAGLAEVHVYGDYHCGPLADDSPRMILTAVRQPSA